METNIVARITTFSFEGIEAKPVDVQVHMAGGNQPAFMIVGLPDKAVAESRERVRAAFSAIGLALPPKRITVNLAPADLPKEGSHYDLAIALGVMAVMGIFPPDMLDGQCRTGRIVSRWAIGTQSGRVASGNESTGARFAVDLPRSLRV